MKITGDYATTAPLAAQNNREAAQAGSFRSVLDNALAAGDDAKLKAACQEFEAVFLKQLFSSMRATVLKSELLDGGMQEDIFSDMLDEAIAGEAAKGQGIGLAEEMYKYFRLTAGAK